MTISKFSFAKFFGLCCLIFPLTILLGIQNVQAQTWPCAGGYTKIWENCGNYLGNEGCNPGDVDVGNYKSPMCGNGEFSFGDRCCPPVATNGSCGSADGVAVSSAPSSNLCASGTASAVSGSGPWSWTCNGSGGGTNASCSAPLAATPVNGSCSATPGVCSAGSVASDNGSTSCGTTRTWNCNGSGGGTNASCSYSNPPCAGVNGTCGTANGGMFAPQPTFNLCGSGTASTVTKSGNDWVWTCDGSGGGTNASCSASAPACWTGDTEACVDICGFGSPGGTVSGFQFGNGSTAWAGPGSCVTHCGGSAAGFYTTASVGSIPSCSTPVNGSCSATPGACNAGSVASDNGLTSCGTTRTWNCNGSGGGTNASCTHNNPVCVVNGSCSTTPGACNAGSVASDNGLTSCGTTRTWNCNGSGGGTNASCTHNNPVCVVNGSCSATPGVCSAGSVASDNGLTSCGTTRTWNCNGSGGGTNASCTYNNPACAVNGSCSATPGACNAGSVASDNGLTSCGTTRTWNCNGSGGGTNASCTHNNPACAVNGTCGAANGVGTYSAPSSGLCSTGTATAVSGTGPFTWSCNGSGGGTNASCSAPLAQNGACGTSHNGNFYTAPSSNLCSVGTASAVGGTGPWTWTCAGVNGGTTANCSANLSVNGSCGSANGTGTTSAPSSNLCASGTATAVSGTGPWTWSCNGSNGGTNASCSAPVLVNGTCGPSNGVGAYSAPSSGLCSTGTATAVSGTGPFTWSCNGANGGSNASCSAPLRQDGQCGTSHNANFYTAPSSNLCSVGTASAVGGTGPWTWTCAGINGGTTANCNANKTIDGVCGTANGVSTPTSPSSGLCSAGNSTSVTNSSNTWNWSCNGINGGTNASCSAPEMINGTCGPANGSSVYTAPSSGLCATGNATSVTGTGPFDWNCNGINGGSDASCSANLTVNGECGPAHGAFTSTTPSSGLCSAGSASAVAGTGPYTWTCGGLNGGTNVPCSSQVVVQGSCGPSNNVPTATAPASGLCATGTASAVTGTGPWTWTCTGSGGGVTTTCTAPTPPPPPSFGGACPA